MKNTFVKILVLCLVALFAFGAVGCSTAESDDSVQESGTVDKPQSGKNDADNTTLGDYSVEIKSCRLAKDYEDKDIVIITYGFTNNKNDDGSSFTLACTDEAFQNGIGLTKSYFVEDDTYNSDNQMKEIKKGASLDVEVAYELNDTESDIVVEVAEFVSLSDKKITKTFSLTE